MFLLKIIVLKLKAKLRKKFKKAEKRFGDSFDKSEFISTNGRVVGYQTKINSILSRLGQIFRK